MLCVMLDVGQARPCWFYHCLQGAEGANTCVHDHLPADLALVVALLQLCVARDVCVSAYTSHQRKATSDLTLLMLLLQFCEKRARCACGMLLKSIDSSQMSRTVVSGMSNAALWHAENDPAE